MLFLIVARLWLRFADRTAPTVLRLHLPAPLFFARTREHAVDGPSRGSPSSSFPASAVITVRPRPRGSGDYPQGVSMRAMDWAARLSARTSPTRGGRGPP